MFGGSHYVLGQINRLIDRIRLIPEVMFEIRQLHYLIFSVRASAHITPTCSKYLSCIVTL